MSGTCPGPLAWFKVGEPEPDAGLLECHACDYLIVTGNSNDERHSETPLLTSPR